MNKFKSFVFRLYLKFTNRKLIKQLKRSGYKFIFILFLIIPFIVNADYQDLSPESFDMVNNRRANMLSSDYSFDILVNGNHLFYGDSACPSGNCGNYPGVALIPQFSDRLLTGNLNLDTHTYYKPGIGNYSFYFYIQIYSRYNIPAVMNLYGVKSDNSLVGFTCDGYYYDGVGDIHYQDQLINLNLDDTLLGSAYVQSGEYYNGYQYVTNQYSYACSNILVNQDFHHLLITISPIDTQYSLNGFSNAVMYFTKNTDELFPSDSGGSLSTNLSIGLMNSLDPTVPGSYANVNQFNTSLSSESYITDFASTGFTNYISSLNYYYNPTCLQKIWSWFTDFVSVSSLISACIICCLSFGFIRLIFNH